MNKGGMNEEGDVRVSRQGELEGGRKVGNMATEKEKERLMKTEDGSLFCQPLPPAD